MPWKMVKYKFGLRISQIYLFPFCADIILLKLINEIYLQEKFKNFTILRIKLTTTRCNPNNLFIRKHPFTTQIFDILIYIYLLLKLNKQLSVELANFWVPQLAFWNPIFVKALRCYTMFP